MSGPTIDRAHSSGDIWTPQNFRGAVQKKFGPVAVDLAAAGPHCVFGQMWISPEDDSLKQGWNAPSWQMFRQGRERPLLWLNPPYANITPWAMKCAAEMEQGAEILLLVPGSIGANWYWDWVEPYATVYSVGRMVFDNCFDKQGELVTTPYPKDLILCHYDPIVDMQSLLRPRMQRWRWKEDA